MSVGHRSRRNTQNKSEKPKKTVPLSDSGRSRSEKVRARQQRRAVPLRRLRGRQTLLCHRLPLLIRNGAGPPALLRRANRVEPEHAPWTCARQVHPGKAAYQIDSKRDSSVVVWQANLHPWCWHPT